MENADTKVGYDIIWYDKKVGWRAEVGNDITTFEKLLYGTYARQQRGSSHARQYNIPDQQWHDMQ